MTTNQTSLDPVKYKPGQHPNSRKNLKVGGIETHGYGNLQGYSLTSDLKRSLHEEAEFISPTARPQKDKLWREQIKRAILTKSAQGDVGMIKELLDRIEGKVPEQHAILGDIRIEVVYQERHNAVE